MPIPTQERPFPHPNWTHPHEQTSVARVAEYSGIEVGPARAWVLETVQIAHVVARLEVRGSQRGSVHGGIDRRVRFLAPKAHWLLPRDRIRRRRRALRHHRRHGKLRAGVIGWVLGLLVRQCLLAL